MTTPTKVPIFLTKRWIDAFSENILNNKADGFVVQSQISDAVIPLYQLGRGKLHSLSNYYSPYFQNFESSLDGAIDTLAILKNARFSKLTLLPVTHDSWCQIVSDLPTDSLHIEKYYHTKNWRHTDIENFEGFKKQCSSNAIKSTERYRRKLKKNTNFKIEVLINQFSDEIFSNYLSVYEKSWKQKEPGIGFLKKIYAEAAELGQLRMGFIFDNDIPVSSQVWFCACGQAFIYKLAYNSEYAKHRVGNILFLEMAQYVIEQDKVTTLDFLTGNDSYKNKWMTNCRNLYGVNVYNKRTLVGWLEYCALMLRKLLKKLLPKPKLN